MSGSAVGLVYVLDIPLAAAWRQECGGRVEAGCPLGWGKTLSVHAVPDCRKCPSGPGRDHGGKNGPLSRANGDSTMSLHTYDLGGP